MPDGHPGSLAHVERQAVAVFGQTFDSCYLAGEFEHAGQHAAVTRGKIGRSGNVLARNDEDVYWGTGTDVANGERVLVLGDPRCGYFAGVYLAKEAVAHDRWIVRDDVAHCIAGTVGLRTMESPARDALSYFWAPLCAVGSHGPGGPNAQICVSVFGASIVPERPRVSVNLWRNNFTTGLVEQTGTLSITLLSPPQITLLEPLGLRSAHAGPKLAGLEYTLDEHGNPHFPGGIGELSCEVISAHSLGDSVAFICAVTARRSFAGEPLTLQAARTLASPEVVQRWNEQNERERAASRELMTWLPRG